MLILTIAPLVAVLRMQHVKTVKKMQSEAFIFTYFCGVLDFSASQYDINILLMKKSILQANIHIQTLKNRLQQCHKPYVQLPKLTY